MTATACVSLNPIPQHQPRSCKVFLSESTCEIKEIRVLMEWPEYRSSSVFHITRGKYSYSTFRQFLRETSPSLSIFESWYPWCHSKLLVRHLCIVASSHSDRLQLGADVFREEAVQISDLQLELPSYTA